MDNTSTSSAKPCAYEGCTGTMYLQKDTATTTVDSKSALWRCDANADHEDLEGIVDPAVHDAAELSAGD